MKQLYKVPTSSTQVSIGKIDIKKGRLTNTKGQEVIMEPRLRNLFLVLLEHEGEFVTRTKLIDTVWKDIYITEQSLTKAISDLRKFFVLNDINHVTITTAPKFGYKMVLSNTSSVTPRNNFIINQIFKVLAYSFLSFVLLIIIIRAVRY